MSDPMAEIRASFFIECEELLEGLLDGLQMMDDGDADEETVNVVFRAVHSIKGGAGAFGLEDLVSFAHKFETAMDEIRSGNLAPDQDILKLFFVCGDILADLVREARDGEPHDLARIQPVEEQLSALIDEQEEEEEEEVDFQPAAFSMDLGLEESEDAPPLTPPGDPEYLIEFKPDASLYSSGNEPLYLFRAVRDLGPLIISCHAPDLPDLANLNPENSYLTWRLKLSTTEGEAVIQEVFDFVDGLCELKITETSAQIDIGAPDLPDLPELSGVSDAPNPAPAEARDEPKQPPATTEQPEISASATASDPTPQQSNSEKKQKEPESPNKTGKSAGKSAAAVAPRATVRVDLDRIDRLVNLVGEIVINQAMLTQSVEEAGLPANSSIRAGLDEFLQLTRDIQESVMMIRAQPVKSLFQRMARIVREASAAIGKEVRLHTEGENTEVDKTVIERLADPLTHMIRNAVDHGLEENQQRSAIGKEATGNITLTAAHRSGRVVIEVADDGGGINRKKVRQIAIDKGLIEEDLQLSDNEIDNLLFLPGFSTATEVSNLSGRGVGMDVVRNAIQALGGRIAISSEQGKGSTFSISLPLTLAVLDGMVIRVARETLVVPLNAIMETQALSDEEIREFGPETHVVNIRDTFVPLLDLGAELGYRDPLEDYSSSVILLIAQEDGTRAAVVVDSIEDQRQVVIKGLQDSYGQVPGIAAATILGDGQIALILDPVDLIAQASGQTRPTQPSQLKAG